MEDSDSSEEFVHFRDRSVYADVIPIPQDDGPAPVVPIAYDPDYVELMGYFRALLLSNELSKRAFQLTTEVIEWTPGNYTAWQYRRSILNAIQGDYKEELEFVSDVCVMHPKNYQVWYHRRCVVERLGDPSEELDFTSQILTIDAKNYHAWSHRQWVIKSYNLWTDEMDFVVTEISKDVRNNSAWNQRYFVFANFRGFTEETIAAELDYTLQMIGRAPNNESSWNYLGGLYRKFKHQIAARIEAFCLEKKSQWPHCMNDGVSPSPLGAHLLALLVNILEDRSLPDDIQLAIQHVNSLIGGIDDIHIKYWQYRLQRLQSRVE